MNYRYGLNHSLSTKQISHLPMTTSIKDGSNNLLERNAFLMNPAAFDNIRDNYFQFKTVLDLNKKRNNYLDPISSFRIKEKPPSDNLNKETLNITRLKYYSRDITPAPFNVKQGIHKSSFEFKAEKNNEQKDVNNSLCSNAKSDYLIEQKILCLDKNKKGELVRHPKGFWKFSPDIREFNRESADSPDLFQILTKSKLNRFNLDLINKEETITLLSRNKSWITVTPRSKNRRKPLENIRVKNDEPSPVLPQWMRPKYQKKPASDFMRKIDNTSVRTGKKTMQLVDIENLTNNSLNRSIFSLGDFRHNLPFKRDCEVNQNNISMNPKSFFNWNDGKIYDPKKKRDYA